VQEELAAVNLAKYRKAQSDLDEAEERLAENAAELSSRARIKNAMSVTASRTGVGVRVSHGCSQGRAGGQPPTHSPKMPKIYF